MLRDCCSDNVKVAAIIGGAIIVSVAIWLYFSPYQSCVRAEIALYEVNDTEYSPGSIARIARTAARSCTPN